MAARSRGKEGESGFSSPSPSPRRSIALRRYRSSQTITAVAVIPCLSPTSQGSSSSAAFIYSSPPSQPCFFVLDPPPPPPWSNRSLLLSRYLRPPTGGYICYPPQYIVLCPEEERGERALITDLLSHIFPYRNYSLEAFPQKKYLRNRSAFPGGPIVSRWRGPPLVVGRLKVCHMYCQKRERGKSTKNIIVSAKNYSSSKIITKWCIKKFKIVH